MILETGRRESIYLLHVDVLTYLTKTDLGLYRPPQCVATYTRHVMIRSAAHINDDSYFKRSNNLSIIIMILLSLLGIPRVVGLIDPPCRLSCLFIDNTS